MNYTTSKMYYSFHLLLWVTINSVYIGIFGILMLPLNIDCLYLRVASSSLECTLLKSDDVFYAYTFILRTRLTRQSAICARRKNRAQFITGLRHRQSSNY